jgi:GMP synthase (glutamine-hydrolysing)
MSKLSVNNKKIDTILVLDFGSQYTQLIARRVRELDVYSEILPWDIDEEKICKINPKGVILSGGPNSVTKSFTPRVPQKIFDLNVPILGICYGMQTLAEQMGGNVISADKKEFGHVELEIVADSKLFRNLNSKINVWMSHGDQVQDLPDDYELTALTSTTPIAAMQHKKLPIYAIQFHPEVTHTENGMTLLSNFIFDECGANNDWKMDDLISSRVEEIKQKVGNNKVLLGLSGGVDSSVTAALLNEAIGKQLTCVFVDNGLLRKGENYQVMQTFKENMNLNVIKSDSQDIFLRHLENIDDPEQKRKIIGRTFIDVFDAEALKLKDIKFLAQGTIYPDVIESSGSESNEARVIKSHHNVGGLPDEMEFDLVEPLRDLFKDEVRKMGIKLGIPKEMLERHPFPGPGLGVRIIGEITKEKISILQEADNIFIEELIKADLYEKVSQAFAVLLPVKSVGVVGDERRYAEVIGLRAVETVDFMTAKWAHLPYEFLEKVSNRIVNEIESVSRVVYDISSKPPATIEWE